MKGSRAVRMLLICASLFVMDLGCVKPSKPVPAAGPESPPVTDEKPDLAAPTKVTEPAKDAATVSASLDLGVASSDGGTTPPDGGETKSAGKADDTEHGDILAIDATAKLRVIKDVEIELRCPRKKADEVTCTVYLQAFVTRNDARVKLCSESDELPGVDIDKLKFESSKAEGEAAVTLVDIPKRGGSLVRVQTTVKGGESTTQSVTDVTWYILELSSEAGSATWKQVLTYEANNLLNHEGEENGPLSMESEVTLESQSRSCYGFPDVVLKSTQTETPHKGRPHERRSKSQLRWNGEVYAEATGKPGADCKKSDSACKKQELFCDHECRPRDTPEYCGDCQHRCPGLGTPGTTVRCKTPESHACDMICAGEHYDLDGKMENGCEVKPEAPVYRTKESALDLGSKNCKDAESRVKFGGVLISDSRTHSSPPIVGMGESGMGPFFARLVAKGGLLCRNDLELRIKSSSRVLTAACFELEVTGGAAPQVVRFGSTDDQVLKLAAPAYRDGDQLFFEVRSRCPRQAARMEFEVALHL